MPFRGLFTLGKETEYDDLFSRRSACEKDRVRPYRAGGSQAAPRALGRAVPERQGVVLLQPQEEVERARACDSPASFVRQAGRRAAVRPALSRRPRHGAPSAHRVDRGRRRTTRT